MPLTASLPFLLHNILAGIIGITGVVCSMQTVLCLKRKEIHVICAGRAGSTGVETSRNADNDAVEANNGVETSRNADNDAAEANKGVETSRNADNDAAEANKGVEVGSNAAALRKSSQAILVMNIGNIVMIIVLMLYTYFGADYPLIKSLGAFVLPIILSATNPLVRIAFSKDIREFIWALVEPLVARIKD